MKLWYSRYRASLLAALAIVSFGISLILPMNLPSEATIAAVHTNARANVPTSSVHPADLLHHARALYEAGQVAEAITIWRSALEAYQLEGNSPEERLRQRLGQASVLSNLSLAHQRLGQWAEATQAINQSLEITRMLAQEHSLDQQAVLAQGLSTQGSLYLELGQPENALHSWEQAIAAYEQAGDEIGSLRSQINQAEALRTLGLQHRALDVLTEVVVTLQPQPDSLIKAIALRRLGDVLRSVGDFEQSQQVLQQSLAIAEQMNLSEDQGATLLSLANTTRFQSNLPEALVLYQQLDSLAVSPITRLQGQLAQLSLLIELEQWESAQTLLPQIQALQSSLPSSHTTIYARINFAQSWIALSQVAPAWMDIAQELTTAMQQARTLGDQRAEAYALGYLGQIYEQTQQWTSAKDLTQQALLLAQANNAPDIAYRWQWQLGRILKAQNKIQPAIAAYSVAVDILQSLRSDLVAISSDIQFSFRSSVEPIYRELVSLLLSPNDGTAVNQQNLVKAREVIEALQLAELDNFFHEACLEAQPVALDQIDPQAAVIYPIILSDRLEVILSLPQQPLQHYTSHISSAEFTTLLNQLRQNLVIRSRRTFLPLSQQLYDWLIRPLAIDLAHSQVKTLVFVLDGALRNIPMSVLHNGTHFLLEDYSIALAPSLQLLDPQPLLRQNVQVLAAGLTEARQNFAPLDYVAAELEGIKTEVPSIVLLNEAFTGETLRTEIEDSVFPIIHIATHGQFSSNSKDTFILAWDKQLDVLELEQILKVGFPQRNAAIELLVLSACETAAGDQRAALGLAGIAVKAGARSTLATLWSVNDQVTSILMSQFYQVLVTSDLPKSEVLRQAQLTLLHDPQYSHPLYWSPYVLVGNWL